MADIVRRFDIKNLVRELAENKVSVLEIVREALSNAQDHGATCVWIRTSSEHRNTVNVVLADNGEGMDDGRMEAFWGVGASAKSSRRTSIGYKGHGTKLFFYCNRLSVATRVDAGAPWRVTALDQPYKFDGTQIIETVLTAQDPLYQEIAEAGLDHSTGTVVRIEELLFDDRKDLLSRVEIESYCDWFTVIGDIRAGLFDERIQFHRAIAGNDPVLSELGLNVRELAPLEVRLRINGERAYTGIGLGPGKKAQEFFQAWKDDVQEFAARPALLAYGHRFADAYDGSGSVTRVRDDTSALRLTGPADWMTEDGIAIVARVEGHRRQLQTYLEARWQGHPGIYGFEERFGLWLCRDFIPITPRHDLLRKALERIPELEFRLGFGNLRNWKVFVNVQQFRLTANRNDISRQEDIETRVKEVLVALLERASKQKGFRDWVTRLRKATLERHKDREIAQMTRRIDEMRKWINSRDKKDGIDPTEVEGLEKLGDDYSLLIRAPSSEQELFYVYGLLSGRFIMPVHVIEYDAAEGVDAIGELRHHASKLLAERRALIRIEFKLEVSKDNPIHHFFDAIDLIICWQVGKGGTIYEETSAEAGTLRKRAKPVLSPPIDTYEIVCQSDSGERVIPIIEVSALFPQPGKRRK
jgi:hypothetical protein